MTIGSSDFGFPYNQNGDIRRQQYDRIAGLKEIHSSCHIFDSPAIANKTSQNIHDNKKNKECAQRSNRNDFSATLIPPLF